MKNIRQNRYLSQAIQLEESTNPVITRLTLITISAGIIAFIAWASFTNINEMAHTPGEVVPQGFQQVVQHLEGGIVAKIDVTEGDLVEKGQRLMSIDGTGSKEDLERAMSKQVTLNMQEERLRAYTENREPDFSAFTSFTAKAAIKDQKSFFDGMVESRFEEQRVIEEQIKQKRQVIGTLQSDLHTAQESYNIMKSLFDKRSGLHKQGYVSDVKFLETQQQLNNTKGDIDQIRSRITVANSEISEFENRLKSLNANQRDEVHERLDQLLADKAQNAELIGKLRDRVKRLEVVSPTRGLVKGLTVNTVGAVIQPGQVLMEIVPLDEELMVQVKIQPQHIGHLKTGQDVQVKFSSFDFSRYGFVPGKITQISATTFTGEKGERYYQGLVELERSHVGDDPHNLVLPGMTVMADIITGRKTILQYLLKPIHTSLKTAFTER
jgi:HlyD family secretion protein/adhesin transport system membrane fusion protein